MRLIKLRVHPTPSPSPPSCYMFKDEDREPRLGRFLRKALTLLSKGSSGASRDVMTIVSSTLDQATASGKQGGKKKSPKHLPLRFTRLRTEIGGSGSRVLTNSL